MPVLGQRMQILDERTLVLASGVWQYGCASTELAYGGTGEPMSMTLRVRQKDKEETLHPPVPYAPRPTPYALYPTPYTLRPTPHALRPTPYTLYPIPYTLRPTLHALRPTPYAVYPIP
eukprot:261567-Rhodomonas_salina.1